MRSADCFPYNSNERPRRVIGKHILETCSKLDILEIYKPEMKTHYQSLPLLREVKPDELPPEPKKPKDEEDRRLASHALDTWEEHVWEIRPACPVAKFGCHECFLKKNILTATKLNVILAMFIE